MRDCSVYEVQCICDTTVSTDESEYSTEATCPKCGRRISMRLWSRFIEVRGTEDK